MYARLQAGEVVQYPRDIGLDLGTRPAGKGPHKEILAHRERSEEFTSLRYKCQAASNTPFRSQPLDPLSCILILPAHVRISPARARMSVVLPAPLVPRTATIARAGTSKDTPCNTSREP